MGKLPDITVTHTHIHAHTQSTVDTYMFIYLDFQPLFFMVEAQFAMVTPLPQEMGEIHACPHVDATPKFLVAGNTMP